MKYIKLYEDLEFDPNNFRKLKKDIKALTIELVDNGFKVQPFEVENDNGFDNYDYYIKIYQQRSKWGFYVDEVRDYIDTIIDYVNTYYTYDKIIIDLDGEKINYATGYNRIVYNTTNKHISQIEIEFDDIKKK